jgi:predicted nucleic acid-binding protein
MPGICSVDTSPLLYLYRINQLTLLQHLFDQVYVADAVVDELSQGRNQGTKIPDLVDYPWIDVQHVKLRSISESMDALGPGERAAMILGLDGQAEWVILDDLEARNEATKQGLKVIGTVGLLASAKNKSLIHAISPLLIQLEESGMWLSAELKRNILELADER